MKFMFENLGPIESGQLDIKNLTIICGKNNTGKTYINYVVYGFYKNISGIVNRIVSKNKYIKEDEGKVSINLDYVFSDISNIDDKVLKEYTKQLDTIFNTTQDMFKKCKINIENKDRILNKSDFVKICKKVSNIYKEVISERPILIDLEDDLLVGSSLEKEQLSLIKAIMELILSISLNETLFGHIISVFMLPAERNGLNIFFKELNVNRNNAIFGLKKSSNIKPFVNQFSKYSLPISDYINFLNGLDENEISNNEIFSDIVDTLENDIIGGKYVVNKDNMIEFKSNNKKESMDLHISSSTAKSLFGLDYYLRHSLRNNDLLIIDEPELNLHPDNQRRLARVLARLVNRGMKILISTHSDYIIKEFNNLIILGRKFNGYDKIMNKYKYTEEELLEESKVSAYISNNGIIQESKIEQEGIIIKSFDEVINCYNISADEIYDGYLEAQDE